MRRRTNHLPVTGKLELWQKNKDLGKGLKHIAAPSEAHKT